MKTMHLKIDGHTVFEMVVTDEDIEKHQKQKFEICYFERVDLKLRDASQPIKPVPE